MILIVMLGGCFGQSQAVLTQNERDEMKVKTIAVLPVDSKDIRSKTTKLLRSRLLEEIYFRGYPRISLQEIDGKLQSLNVDSDKGNISAIPPEQFKELLQTDAVMHCALSEKNKTGIFYVPAEINVACTLRRTEDGKTIWQAKSEAKSNHFDITPRRLEKKISEDYDVLIDQVVNDIMKTLPDGPNLRS